jgi:acyl phosphate:glycerol-3-phosphate acyltransferase
MLQHHLIYATAAVAAYLVGAIPFGYLLVKLRTGKDVRTLGSGNIGATNVARVLGTAWFVPVFVLDFLKGFAPIFWGAPWVAKRWPCEICDHLPAALAVLFGLFAMLGHMFPAYLKFRGGKGVATVAGVLFAMNWMATLVGLGAWLLVFLPTRYVSLGSIASAIAVPIAHHFTAARVGMRSWIVTLFFVLACLLVIVRHRGNIQRLLAGTETRVGKKVA